MLWTDANFITEADMLRVDSEVSEVAASESTAIDITNDVIPMAIGECGIELFVHTQQFGGYFSNGNFSSNHLQAVFSVGSPGLNRSRITLGQLVVDNLTLNPLKTWVLYKALRYFYRDAFARTKNDRYVEKMKQFDADIERRHWPNLKTLGLPVVYNALPCPGAILERSGTWAAANVTSTALTGPTGGAFFVAISYVDSSRYLGPAYGSGAGAANNGESYVSAVVAKTIATDNVLGIDITSLIPPSGTPDPAQAAASFSAPLTATGWNLYVGASAIGPLYLQNTTPIPIATKTYTLAADPVLSGSQPRPQYVEAYLTIQDRFQRA